MINEGQNPGCSIYSEMNPEKQKFWFDFKQKKFLHNIDTFYYSVMLEEDFTINSTDPAVLKLRHKYEYYKHKFSESYDENRFCPFYVPGKNTLNVLPLSFAKMYTFWLEYPEEFSIIFAPVVPRGSGNTSVTCQLCVQIRSALLWKLGVYGAFEKSYEYAKAIIKMFGFHIKFVQENRSDFCFHTNYFLNPTKFFNLDNLYKLRVDHFKEDGCITCKMGKESYEIDYMRFGKREHPIFLRIYHKTKEVIEKGYKPFFFKEWFFNGLISRYDLYCYEEAYKKGKYKYIQIARLKWYLEHGTNDFYKQMCNKYINDYELKGRFRDDIFDFAFLVT